jgi:hypothetical protein
MTSSAPSAPADLVLNGQVPVEDQAAVQHLDEERGHDHEGLGLGLSSVGAIANAHSATLSIHPQPAASQST